MNPIALMRHSAGLWRLRGTMRDFYRVQVTTIGVRLGAFEALAGGADARGLAERLQADPQLLALWLALARQFGLVNRRGDRYVLTSYARTFLLPGSPHYLGHNFEEAVAVEGAFLEQLPSVIRSGERPPEPPEWSHKGALAGVVFEPYAFRVLSRLPIRRQGYRVLDVGCGHGDYLRYLARTNPTLTGVGVDITAGTVEYARRRVEEEGLAKRIAIVQEDAREMDLGEQFDLCLLNNNLYYFDPAAWPTLFATLAKHLRDGGHLAIQAPVRGRGRDAVIDVFDLYLRGHKGTFGLPSERDVRAALKDAGFSRVKTSALWPFGQWLYLIAQR
jgi:SAM-dependent methyltransferase